VSIADPQARLIGEYPFAAGIPGEWRPGGFQLVAFLPADGVLYVLMHKKAIEGGHVIRLMRSGLSMCASQHCSRGPLQAGYGITAGVHGEPALYSWEKEAKTVTRYPIDRNAGSPYARTRPSKSTKALPGWSSMMADSVALATLASIATGWSAWCWPARCCTNSRPARNSKPR